MLFGAEEKIPQCDHSPSQLEDVVTRGFDNNIIGFDEELNPDY